MNGLGAGNEFDVYAKNDDYTGLYDNKKRKLNSLLDGDESMNYSWEKRFAAFVRYGEQYGDCNVAFGDEYVMEDGSLFKIGHWLNTQRQDRRKGVLRPDREERMQQLVDSGKLKWTMRSLSKVDTWELYFNILIAYGSAKGDYNVPFHYEVTGHDNVTHQLGYWLYTQRQNRRKSKLDPYRLARLQALVDDGKLKWEVRESSFEDTWNENYASLLAYGQRTGHCNVPFAYETEKGHKLGKWLDKQRQLHKRNMLPADRLERLQVLVDNNSMRWAVLRTNSRLAQGNNDNNSNTTAANQQLPNNLPLTSPSSSGKVSSWEANYKKLLEFCGRYDHCNPLLDVATVAANGGYHGMALGKNAKSHIAPPQPSHGTTSSASFNFTSNNNNGSSDFLDNSMGGLPVSPPLILPPTLSTLSTNNFFLGYPTYANQRTTSDEVTDLQSINASPLAYDERTRHLWLNEDVKVIVPLGVWLEKQLKKQVAGKLSPLYTKKLQQLVDHRKLYWLPQAVQPPPRQQQQQPAEMFYQKL